MERRALSSSDKVAGNTVGEQQQAVCEGTVSNVSAWKTFCTILYLRDGVRGWRRKGGGGRESESIFMREKKSRVVQFLWSML